MGRIGRSFVQDTLVSSIEVLILNNFLKRFFFGFPKDFSISFDAKFILSRSKKLPSQALHQKLKLNSFPLNIMCKRFLALVKAELQHQFPHHFWI